MQRHWMYVSILVNLTVLVIGPTRAWAWQDATSGSAVTPGRPSQPASPAAQPATAREAQEPPATRPAVERLKDPITLLKEEIDALRAALLQARQDLARARLEMTEATRELDELRQFIADHHEFGEDFLQYQSVKAAAEREAQRKEMEANRAKREAEKTERRQKAQAARAAKEQRDAVIAKVARYRKSGFGPLGLDVYSSKMAFFYEAKDTSRTRVDYDPLIGDYLRPLGTTTEIDYSQMTISGSVLNAADEIRNIGVAITFFDANGNQVGHEMVQINNARPDVPYPFTSKIEMALNKPFASSSTYVLYADPIDLQDGS